MLPMKLKFEDIKEISLKDYLVPGDYDVEYIYPNLNKLRVRFKLDFNTKTEELAKDGLKIIKLTRVR